MACFVEQQFINTNCAAAVLTFSDMTSDAQTPLAHAAMLSDTYDGTSGFQWHVSLVNGLRLVSHCRGACRTFSID